MIYAYANYGADFPLDERRLTANFAGQPLFEIVEDEDTREGWRYGLGFTNTWATNASLIATIDVQDFDGGDYLTGTLGYRQEF